MIGDPHFRPAIEVYARYVLGMGTSAMHGDGMRWVRTWDELRATLAEYAEIDELIIYTHGADGALILGGSHRPLVMLREFFTQVPDVDTIRVEGCNVGKQPAGMLALARLLHAFEIQAFNAYHMTQDIEIAIAPIPPHARETELRRNLELLRDHTRHLARYLVPHQPSIEMIARSPGRHVIHHEFFRSWRDLVVPLRLSPTDLAPRDLYARSQARNVVLTAGPGEVFSGDFTFPFQLVTVQVPEEAEQQPPAAN